VIRQLGKSFQQTMGLPMFPQRGSDQEMGGRITRSTLRRTEKSAPRTAASGHRSGAALDERDDGGWTTLPVSDADAVVWPPPAGGDRGGAVARHNKWLCERVLAHEPRLISLLYLPSNDRPCYDPGGVLTRVKDSATRKARRLSRDGRALNAVQRDEYMKTYTRSRDWESRSPHAATTGRSKYMEQMKSVSSVHALGFPIKHPAHDQSIINGIFERFPKAADHVDRGRGRVGAVPESGWTTNT